VCIVDEKGARVLAVGQRIQKRGIIDDDIGVLTAAAEVVLEVAFHPGRHGHDDPGALSEAADSIQESVKRHMGSALGNPVLDDSVGDPDGLRLSEGIRGADQLHITMAPKFLVQVVVPKLATALWGEKGGKEIDDGDLHGAALPLEAGRLPRQDGSAGSA